MSPLVSFMCRGCIAVDNCSGKLFMMLELLPMLLVEPQTSMSFNWVLCSRPIQIRIINDFPKTNLKTEVWM